MRARLQLLPLALVVAWGCGGTVEEASPSPEPRVTEAPVPTQPGPPASACTADVTPSPATREGRTDMPVARSPELVQAREVLVRVVQDHGRDPANPWAISHAILALGPDITLTNGQPAVDWLFSEYAEPEGVGVGFPTRRGEIRIEPHTDLMLKALTEAGLPPDRAVTVKGEARTLADLYRQSLCGAWVQGEQVSFGTWNDAPWALQGLAAWAPEGLAWSTAGHAMTLDGFTSAVVGKLHEETAFMRQAMERGATVQKRRQGIFGYTCGGAHLIQGAQYAVARGFGTPEDRARAAAEIPVLLWRIDVELSAVDQAVQQHPEYAPVLLEQRMKFLGHLLETTHRASALGLFTPSESQRQTLDRATSELVRTVQVLDQAGLFGQLEQVRASNEQLYLDFVGDAAHAVRGIDLALGDGVIRY